MAAAGCGNGSPTSEPAEVPHAGPQHVHGLGINPADGSLAIATHTGLFKVAKDATVVERVGESQQDTMGFTVLGRDRFLGSGHPDVREDLPPLLGLIRSEDAGRTWESVSLLGEADFHVLRAAGRHVYGFDATQARLLVSADAGRTWERRSPPATVIDLAVDPADQARVVASTESGVFSSVDAGGTWRPMDRGIAGLLAWTSAGLVLVDGRGQVHSASGTDDRFKPMGEIGGQPAALASHGDDLYVALHTNEVMRSDDDGRTWSLRVAP